MFEKSHDRMWRHRKSRDRKRPFRNRKYVMRMHNWKFRNTPIGVALKFHPKHVTNKNKTKHIMKISHISFIWLLKIPSLEYYTTYPKTTNFAYAQPEVSQYP
jgi:hypothetical protein